LQGGAGIKLYLTPSEEKTVSDLSRATGMTTRRVVSKSRTIGKGAFNGVNVSERTEERPLLSEDEARRLPKDDVIIIVDADMPIRAKRIQYFKDATLKPIFEAQTGPLPMPPHNPDIDSYAFSDVGLPDADAARKAAEAKPEDVTPGPEAVQQQAPVRAERRSPRRPQRPADASDTSDASGTAIAAPRSSRRPARKADAEAAAPSSPRSPRRPKRKALMTQQPDLFASDVPDTAENRAVVDRAIEAGVSLLDKLHGAIEWDDVAAGLQP